MDERPPSAFTPALRESVLRGIGEHIDRHPRPPKRRRRRLLPPLVASVVLLGGAATATAWIVLAPPEVQQHRVWCYTQPSPDAPYSEGQLDDDVDVSRVKQNALSVCTAAWRDGLVGNTDGPRDSHDSRGPFPVPTLAVCGRSDGTVTVFPAPGTSVPVGFCHSLGLFDYRG